MWKTVLRRFILMLPQIFILSILIFVLAKMMPGDPFTGMITPSTDAARLEELRRQAGLYDSWDVQYIRWIKNIFQGDFGQSYQYKRPVIDLIGSRVMNTVWLSLLTLILTYLIAVPLGLLAGRYQNTWIDKVIVAYNFITFAIPPFVFYLLALWVFGYILQWTPTNGTVSVDVTPGTMAYFWDKVHHLILPAIVAAILSTTSTVQYLRSEIIDSKSQDYVKTARAKGVPEKVVFRRHILRNSMLPIAAFMGYEITGLLGGSIFIETIFAYPGMGQLFISSIQSRDYSVITALVLIFGIASLVGTLLSDIIMSIVDPRIRIE